MALTAVKEVVPKGVRALCIFHTQVVYKAEKCTVSKTEICLCTLGVQDIPKPGLTHSVSKCYTQHTLIISKPWHCCRVPKSFPSRATDHNYYNNYYNHSFVLASKPFNFRIITIIIIIIIIVGA